MLNMERLSGAPWGTPARGVKEGPVKLRIWIWILRLVRKLARILAKRLGRRSFWERSMMSFSCHTRSKAPLMSLDTMETL